MTVGNRHLRPIHTVKRLEVEHAYYDKSWALIIGINNYDASIGRLVNACNDAQAVADILHGRYHFDQVHTLYDEQATRQAILEWLRDKLPVFTGQRDRVIIFFAGHGVTQPAVHGYKRGYLIPHDARPEKYADYIDMRELLQACGAIPAKHIFIILDCCFSGVAAISGRAALTPSPTQMDDIYLRRITEKGAWQILTAGDSDDLIADNSLYPGHSVFTGVLLAGLEGAADHDADSIFTANDLAAYVKPRVTRESAINTGRSQTPFFNYLASSAEGDFVFTIPHQPSAIDFDWVTIPAGEFLMGSINAMSKKTDNERPQHSLYLPEYRIARTPVTNAQYKKFIDATGYKPHYHRQGWQFPSGKENHPAGNISWQDAMTFCQWTGVRLPTEAEWEKAARGTDGRIWPWGNEPPDCDRGHFDSSIRAETMPVGNYPKGASIYGVLDMAGNVWEWTSSLYKHYPYRADDGREDPNDRGLRVLRGGSFQRGYWRSYCAFRNYHGIPDYSNGSIGFRVVAFDS